MENSYPQRMAGIGSRILMVCTVIHLGGAANSGEPHPSLLLMLWAALDLLDHVAQEAEQLERQPGPVAELKLADFQVTLNKEVRRACPNEVYVASKIQRISLEVVFLSYR